MKKIKRARLGPTPAPYPSHARKKRADREKKEKIQNANLRDFIHDERKISFHFWSHRLTRIDSSNKSFSCVLNANIGSWYNLSMVTTRIKECLEWTKLMWERNFMFDEFFRWKNWVLWELILLVRVDEKFERFCDFFLAEAWVTGREENHWPQKSIYHKFAHSQFDDPEKKTQKRRDFEWTVIVNLLMIFERLKLFFYFLRKS